MGRRGQAKLDLHQLNPSVWALRSVATQTRWQWRLLGYETAALAPVFFQQAHVGDGHAAVHGFAHVVDGEQGHLHGGQGFPCRAPKTIALRVLNFWLTCPEFLGLVGQDWAKTPNPMLSIDGLSDTRQGS